MCMHGVLSISCQTIMDIPTWRAAFALCQDLQQTKKIKAGAAAAQNEQNTQLHMKNSTKENFHARIYLKVKFDVSELHFLLCMQTHTHAVNVWSLLPCALMFVCMQ